MSKRVRILIEQDGQPTLEYSSGDAPDGLMALPLLARAAMDAAMDHADEAAGIDAALRVVNQFLVPLMPGMGSPPGPRARASFDARADKQIRFGRPELPHYIAIYSDGRNAKFVCGFTRNLGEGVKGISVCQHAEYHTAGESLTAEATAGFKGIEHAKAEHGWVRR